MSIFSHNNRGTSSQTADLLWRAHWAAPSDRTRNALMEHYLPIVRFAAVRLASKNGRRARSGDTDDLQQYGIFGLRDAIRGFDPSRGFKFETYCLQRVRGAMLDGLKAGNWVPRDIRQSLTRFHAVREELEAEQGAGMHDQAAASRMGVSEEAIQGLKSHAVRASMCNLSSAEEAADGSIESRFADHREESADETQQRKDVRDLLLRELNRTERQVMMLYYYEDMTMREIGEVMDISGTRVSQIHSDIVARLRAKLTARVSDETGKTLEPLSI